MGSSVHRAMPTTHRLLSEIGPTVMAKADLKKFELDCRAAMGRCVERARKALGWSQKELADAIEHATGEARDVAQISRWEKGSERPQFDVLWSVESMRGPLVIALASLSEQIEVNTTIQIKRTA